MATITIDEAANYLGVSTRTISTYISQGLLSFHKKTGSNKKFLDTEEVREMQEARAQSKFSIREVPKLRAKIKKLEMQMEFLFKILDGNKLHLGIDKTYASDLYNAAIATQTTVITTETMKLWSDVFLQMSEQDIGVMAEATVDTKAWVPLLRLCNDMIVKVVGNQSYHVSVELQTLHRELAEGRRRLRLSVLLYMEERGYDTSVERLVNSTPESIEDTLRRVVKKAKKSS